MADELTPEAVAAMHGIVLLEFGASWCGICRGARPAIDRALADYPGVRHIWIEDGPGKRLGRSFGIKLWPTLVVLRDGREVARVVRPRDTDAVHALLAGDAAGPPRSTNR
jgi:thioredoxin 1